MRVWTNGSFARVWLTDTIYRYRDGALRVEESVKKVKGALDDAADEVVAWSPKGARLDPALDKKRRKVIDAVALGEDRVAGVISEGRSGPRLVVGPPKGPYEVDLALKGRDTIKVDWPACFGAAAKWSDADKPSGVVNRGVRIHTSAHGVAVGAGDTGHVFLWRHGAEDLACSLRVPSQKEARVDAIPTKEGVLVTLRTKKGPSAVAHVAEDGAVLGVWPKGEVSGCFPTLRLDDDKALAFDAEDGALALLSLPDLSELGREPLADPIVDAAVGPAGGTVVMSDGVGVYDVTIDDETVSIDGPYLIEEATPAEGEEEGANGYDPVRTTGPAQVSFPAGKKLPKDPPWALAVEKRGPIKMRLRSGGGAGAGIEVRVGGAAVQKGVVKPVAVRGGGKEVEFLADGGDHVAVLKEIELPQGIHWPLDPKPTRDDEKEAAQTLMAATHFAIDLVLEGVVAGNELMTVAVCALDSHAAPLKRTRPITVE